MRAIHIISACFFCGSPLIAAAPEAAYIGLAVFIGFVAVGLASAAFELLVVELFGVSP